MTNIGEPFRRITVVEANQRIVEGGIQIVDVRTPSEYATGHVPGSINIPHTAIIPRKGELDPEKELLFICRSGQRSGLACEYAAAAGFRGLHNIEGGMLAWVEAGLSVE